MIKLLKKLLNWRHEKDSEPWASFEINGFEKDGLMKVSTAWNSAFIEAIGKMGFQAETPEDSVQLFFYTAQARPAQYEEEDPARSTAHPNLLADTHRLQQ